KAPQDHMKTMMARLASAGSNNGKPTRRKMRNSLAPSTRAASSNSSGKSAAYWRIMNTPNAFIMPGTSRPGYEFSQPKALTSINNGTTRTWNGTIMVESTARNSKPRPGNWYLAKPKPASAPKNTVIPT